MREFLEVFPNDLPGNPPKREIDFGINLLPDTNPMSIPPYRMTPDELKEFKSHLKIYSTKVSLDLVFLHGSLRYYF